MPEGTSAPGPIGSVPPPVASVPVSKPLSQIVIPGTKIPVDAAIAYSTSIVTEILNSNIVTNPHYQVVLHVISAVLVAVGHALQTDGL